MIPTPRARALLDAGKLKLAAKARLAEGGPEAAYEAAVLYHDGARAEHRALLATASPSPEARLVSAIERCACLILGLDASAVLEVGWADVLVARAVVDEATAGAMCAKIDAMMRSFVERYQKVVRKKPTFELDPETRRLVGSPKEVRAALERCLKAFPGDAFMWALRSAHDAEDGDIAGAWGAIQRARELRPEETSFVGWELRLVTKRLPVADAEARLAAAYADIERGGASAGVCFGFIVGVMDLAAKRRPAKQWIEQAIHAAIEGGRASPRHSEDQLAFRAVELGLREMLAGRKPGLAILYRCGLGRLAAVLPQDADWMSMVLAQTARLPLARRLAA